MSFLDIKNSILYKGLWPKKQNSMVKEILKIVEYHPMYLG